MEGPRIVQQCNGKASQRESLQRISQALNRRGMALLRNVEQRQCTETQGNAMDLHGNAMELHCPVQPRMATEWQRDAGQSNGMARRGAAMELSSAVKKCMERSIKNAPSGVADRTGRRNKS